MVKLFLKLFLVVLCSTVAHCKNIADQLIECPDGAKGTPEKTLVKLTYFSVTGCTTQPCSFEKGKTYEGKFRAVIDFTIKPDTELTYTISILTKVGPVQVWKDDVCPFLKSGTCDGTPKGTEISGKFKEKIDDVVPAFSGEGRLVALKDGKPVFCGQLAIEITDNKLGVGIGGILSR